MWNVTRENIEGDTQTRQGLSRTKTKEEKDVYT